MKSVLTADNLTYMLGGMKLTLEIAVCASVIAILLGTILALAKTYCLSLIHIFHAYASMVERDRKRIADSCKEMYTVNLGGTAIGSAINVSDAYFYNVVPCLARITGYPLSQAADLFDATENLDGFVAVSGAVKTCAVNLSKMCNDLRLLSSGPRTCLLYTSQESLLLQVRKVSVRAVGLQHFPSATMISDTRLVRWHMIFL